MDRALTVDYAHCRYPHGLLEGINNKIKVIKRMAYDFRDYHGFFSIIRAGFPGIPGSVSFWHEQ